MNSQQQWQQPSLFTPQPTLTEIYQHIQAHPAWWALWTLAEVLQQQSPTPLKSQKSATLWVLQHHTDKVIQSIEKAAKIPCLTDGKPDLQDMAQYLRQYRDVLTGGQR